MRLFRGDEQFRPLGSDADKPVRRGEFGYVDGRNRVICRLDSLQAEFSKVTFHTTSALLIVEATTTHELSLLHNVFADARAIINRYCGGTSEVVAHGEWTPVSRVRFASPHTAILLNVECPNVA